MLTRRGCSAGSPLELLWCLPLILTTYGGKLCFSSFSSLSFDIALTTHSGSLIGTQEGDQEPSPRPQTKTKTNRHSRPGDGDAPIYQLTLERAESSRSVSRCHEYNKMTSSERTGKFKQIHESSNCLLTFASFETLPSSPPSSSSSACGLHILPSHLCYGFSGKRVYCKISRL